MAEEQKPTEQAAPTPTPDAAPAAQPAATTPPSAEGAQAAPPGEGTAPAAAEAPAGFGNEVPAKKEPKKVAPAVKKKVGLARAVGESMGSKRLHVKLWAWLFIASVIGLSVSSYGLFRIWMRHKEIQAEIKKQQEVSPEELAKKLAAEKKLEGEEYLARNLSLGVFQFQMKKMATEPEPRDIQNIAQIEISVLCDSLATKEYITSHMQLVKDGVTQALIGFSRKDLMSSEGKKSIQEKILIKVNVSLPEGRVERVFFTKLILS